MNKIIILVLLILCSISVFSQNIPERINFPDTLWTTTDTFHVQGSNSEKEWSFTTFKSDTIDLGTDGYEGVSMKVWTDIDTINIPYVNCPNEQWIFIPIASAKDTCTYRLRFNSQSSVFSKKYIKENTSEISFEIPETYELSNIILFLTDCSILTNNHNENTAYAKRMYEWFKPYRNHTLIKMLNTKCSQDNYWRTYYGFRENSVCFRFNENSILEYGTPYKSVMSDDSKISGGEFRNLLYLVQDFVEESNFRKFYNDNKEYYQKLVSRQSELQPLKRMWEWLEFRFPQEYDSYKVIFSPLIVGSHSTQKYFSGSYKKPEYQECIMFVSSSESIDEREGYSENLKEGLMSGIVFTEIDHNYVNPTSLLYIDKIKDLITDKDLWASKQAQKNYRSEYAIFNEYMTHSLFCLYVDQNYETSIAMDVIKKRIQLMERRGYPKFKDFNEKLMQIMKDNRDTIYDSYAIIIDGMKTIE